MRKHLPEIQLLQALQLNSFALLWSGQTISLLGDNVFSIALAWIVVSLTGSSVAMSLVVVAQIVPSMIFMLLGGAIADRLPKISIMLWSDLSRGIIVLFIMICALFHVLQFWQLLLMALVFGVVDSFFSPAYQSLTPQIVDADRLTSAN
jgi:MFS family permease